MNENNTQLILENPAFWSLMLCTLLRIYQRFG